MPLPVSQSIQITANGTDVSSSVDYNSIQLNLVLTKEVSTLVFNVKGNGNLPGKYMGQIGDIIYFNETTIVNGTTVTTAIFGGTVTEIERVNNSAGSQGGILLTDEITATDWGFQANAKLITQSFSDMDPGAIVQAIAPAGYNATTYVQFAGYNITTIKFNYEQFTQCMEALANQIGFQWYVDANKNIHFFLAENNNAPITIDDTSGGFEYNTLDVDMNLANMKNSVFVIGGTYASIIDIAHAVDVYVGNSQQMGFGLVYSYIASTLAVLLNGVAQSIGILNQETSPSAFNVLYDPAGKTITFNVAPPSGQTIKVFGTAEIPIVGHAVDGPLVAQYGERQDAIFDANILSITEAQERAQADILQYGNPVYDVKFTTLTPGIRLGQNIILNSVLYGISNYPLVVKNITGTGRTGFQMEYAVECVGSDVVTFVDLMKTVLQNENSNSNVADNSTLEVLLSDMEDLIIIDSISNPTSHTTKNYVWGATTAGTVGTWGLFTWA